jgi:hypothetical protein
MQRRHFLQTAVAATTLGGVAAASASTSSRQLFEPALVAGKSPHPTRAGGTSDIGDRKQLFLDDLMIDRTEGISKFVGRVQKYEKNPILVPDKPWERGWTGSDGMKYTFPKEAVQEGKQLTRTEGLRMTGQAALYDEEEKLFKLWYCPWLWENEQQVERQALCYAVSTDGYHWEKPELGLFDFKGSKKSNILNAYDYVTYFNFIKDPHDPDPNRRYKAMGEVELSPTHPDGVAVAFSPDGIRWTEWKQNPVVAKGPNMTDAPTMLGWDPLRQKYVAYYRPGPPIYKRKLRSIGYSESDDFVHWTDTKLMLAMDADDRVDYEYMQFTAGIHGDFYVGFLMMYEKHEQTWSTYLLSSRDGFHWTWVDRHVPFLGRGEIGSYDAAYQTPCGPIIHDGKIWIYYGAFRIAHSYLPSKFGTHDIMTIALATLPVDRYAGLLGGNEPGGTVLTHSLQFKGSKLMLDFDASLTMQRYLPEDPRSSRVRAAVLDESGRSLDAFALDRCRPLYGHGRQEMVWPNANLAQLAGKPVRLLLQIQNAALYSLQFVEA